MIYKTVLIYIIPPFQSKRPKFIIRSFLNRPKLLIRWFLFSFFKLNQNRYFAYNKFSCNSIYSFNLIEGYIMNKDPILNNLVFYSKMDHDEIYFYAVGIENDTFD